jgi:hypothetical protein
MIGVSFAKEYSIGLLKLGTGKMNKKSIGKIVVFIFIAVLLLLTCHFFFHGIEKDDGHCSLCELLDIGLTSIEYYGLLLLLLFIAVLLQINFVQLALTSHLKIQLRAPPLLFEFLNERKCCIEIMK